MWINVGRPERAYEWHQKYTKQFPDKTPLVRSWCVELDVFKDSISICEAQDKGKKFVMRGSALNTDQTSSPNQFLFKGESLYKIIENSIPQTYQSSKGEEVKSLMQEFGLSQELKTIKLFSDEDGNFQTKYALIAQRLNTHYLTWLQSVSGMKGRDVVNASIEKNLFSNDKLETSAESQDKVYNLRLEWLVNFLIDEGVISERNQSLQHPDVKSYMEKVVIENANIAQAKNVLRVDYNHMLFLNKKGLII